MLTLLNTENSYCHKCSKNTTVGKFEVSGWNYVILICASCIEKFATRIRMEGSNGKESDVTK